MPRRPDLVRRAELAHAAIEVLRVRGMQTSMRELADALGIKRPTLYFYFPDLGAVFEAVLEQLYQALTEAVLASVAAQAHPIDRMRAVIDAILAFHRERPQLTRGLFQRWALGGRDRSIALERERRSAVVVRDAMIAELRAGIARKEVRVCEPERVVDLVLAFVQGAVVHQVIGVGGPHGAASGSTSDARLDEATDEATDEAIDEAIDELARRVLEPLRVQRRKKRARA